MASNIKLVKPSMDILRFEDGTSLKVCKKVPDGFWGGWEAVKAELELDPVKAREFADSMFDSDRIRSGLQSDVLSGYYTSKILSGDDGELSKRVGELAESRDLGWLYEDVKRGGTEAAYHHFDNAAAMLKISKAVGGVPANTLETIK